MQKNELLQWNNTIIRILTIDDARVLVIDCVKRTMPQWINSDALTECNPCEKSKLEMQTEIELDDFENLNIQERRIAHERYTMIAGVLPFIADESLRSMIIDKIADEKKVSKQTVRRYLCLYLAFDDMSVLCSKRKIHKKTLTEDEKNIRWALNKFFYTSRKNSLQTAYTLMLKEKYCDKNTLRLAPLEKEAQNLDAADASMEEILEDTEKNTQLVLKMRGESYPVRDCAIRTILSRAGVNGDGLRKLDKATYAKVVNYCLRVAKGDALIKIADGKVSAVHGGDKHDYCILDMKAMFETTCEYLNLNFKGSVYMEGSGIYDHSIVSAMWKLGGSQELLDTYRKALDAHGMDEKILSPALRFTTSDVAASGANLYPMLLTDGPNGVISLGSPIKLAHDKGATILDFRKNLEQVCARYVDAMKNLTQLMDIEIRNPVNCLKLLMKELGIKQKIRNEVVELFVSQNGEGACTAHDLYYAMNEASFFAACEGMSGQGILKLEEDITKALIKDWKKYDVYGAVKC